MTYTLVCGSVGWVVRRATCPVAVWSAYSVRGRPVTRCRFGSPPRPSPYRAGLGHDCHASVVTSCGQGLLCVLRPLAGVPHGLVLSICPSMPTRVQHGGSIRCECEVDPRTCLSIGLQWTILNNWSRGSGRRAVQRFGQAWGCCASDSD